MNPSEKIIKLDKTVHFGSKELTLTDLHNELVPIRTTIESIINYLDSEKERINDALHEIVRELPIAGSPSEAYLHAMIDEKLVDSIVGNNNELHHD